MSSTSAPYLSGADTAVLRSTIVHIATELLTVCRHWQLPSYLEEVLGSCTYILGLWMRLLGVIVHTGYRLQPAASKVETTKQLSLHTSSATTASQRCQTYMVKLRRAHCASFRQSMRFASIVRVPNICLRTWRGALRCTPRLASWIHAACNTVLVHPQGTQVSDVK